MHLVDELQSELDLLLNQRRLMNERHREEEETLDLKILDLSNRIYHWNTEHAQAESDNQSLSSDGCYCDEDQGAGYTYYDEHGPCDYCKTNQ